MVRENKCRCQVIFFFLKRKKKIIYTTKFPKQPAFLLHKGFQTWGRPTTARHILFTASKTHIKNFISTIFNENKLTSKRKGKV